MPEIVGKLEPFFETGTEGIVWSVYEDGKTGYEGLNPLKNNDYLVIFDKDDATKIIWEDSILFEYETNKVRYPLNPEYSQQAINGVWVNGLPVGVDPDLWFSWFEQRLCAKLIKSWKFPTGDKP